MEGMKQNGQIPAGSPGEPGDAAASAGGDAAGPGGGGARGGSTRRAGEEGLSAKRWRDKFTPATAEELLSDLGERRAGVDRVRSLLLGDAQVAENVSWQGVSWRWSLVYTRPGDATRAWAYVVPDPCGPRICVPLPEGATEQIRMRRLKKGAREAVLHGQVVAGVRWVMLEIGGGGGGGGGAGGAGAGGVGIDEIDEILRAKRECGGCCEQGDSGSTIL